MKYKLLLIGFVAAIFTSCSTYKAGQTPDDVYYSPAKEAVAKKEVKNDRYEGRDRYEDYVSSEDDRYLRMKVRNRQRWSTIDDYDYWYDSRYTPYYSYNYYRNNWNNYMWNFNSPYVGTYFGYNSLPVWVNYNNYYGYGYPRYGYPSYYGSYGGKTQTYITKRPPNVSRPSLNGYNNRSYNNNNNIGNTLMKVFTPSSSNSGYSNTNTRSSGSNSNSTYTAPERTYTPSSSASSSSSSSSSSGSSGGGVSRPARGGN